MRIEDGFAWLVGGPAGAGVKTTGLIFAKTLMRGGYHVFTNSEYPSLIRGGHNSEKVTFRGDRSVYAQKETINVLVALDQLSLDLHLKELEPEGIVIYDDARSRIVDEKRREDLQYVNVPLRKIARGLSRNAVLMNTVALGATLAVFDYDLNALISVIHDIFKAKEKIVGINVSAAEKGYQYVKETYPDLKLAVVPIKEKVERDLYLMTGNEAISLGAIKAGMKFFAGYPMTPASSIMHTLAAFQEEFNHVVIQAESEIAAINMVVGAATTGARSMTATSGGGFSLMVETLGLAAMSETPIVIALAQRPGPSTGLPTRTTQADLRFALHASQGEFPRFVLAPGDVEECFYMTADAFNLAEKFQVPSIILTDKYLSESSKSVEWFDESKVQIDRGSLVKDEDLPQGENEVLPLFKRYEITETGVSPRAVFGQKAIIKLTGNEHDEHGFTGDNPKTSKTMTDKRWRKEKYMLEEIEKLGSVKVIGPDDADVTAILWGSTKGPALETKYLLEKEGISMKIIQVRYLSPFPTETVSKLLNASKNVFLMEQNKTAQLGGLIREHTGIFIEKRYLKYDGWPIEAPQVVEFIKSEVLKQ